MKKIILFSILFILTSCGSNGNNKDSSSAEETNISKSNELLRKKDTIVIIKNKNKNHCESKEFYNSVAKLSPKYKDIMIRSGKESISCQDYSNSTCTSIDAKENNSFHCCIIGSEPIISSSDADEWYKLWFYNDAYQTQLDTGNELQEEEQQLTQEESSNSVPSQQPSNTDTYEAIVYDSYLEDEAYYNGTAVDGYYDYYDDYNNYNDY